MKNIADINMERALNEIQELEKQMREQGETEPLKNEIDEKYKELSKWTNKSIEIDERNLSPKEKFENELEKERIRNNLKMMTTDDWTEVEKQYETSRKERLEKKNK